MARKEAQLTSIQITQQLEDEMWGVGWSDEIEKRDGAVLRQCLAAARGGDIIPLTDAIKSLLESSGHHLRDCYGILHNEDVREVWSEAEGKMVVETKPLHGHWVVYFQAGEGDTLDNIAAILGLPPQQLEKTQKGKYGYDNSLAYLVHVKYTDKHQYAPDMVYTAAGRPYAEIASARWEAWLKGRSSIMRKNALEGIDDLEQMILDGRVTHQQVVLTDAYFAIYARYKKRCDDAFDAYAVRKAYKTMRALENGDFRLSVFFFVGEPGSGKTRLAKGLIESLVRKSAEQGSEWHVYKTAASNPVDDYRGEEIVFMDDVRGTAMSAADWLKLLDTENITPNGARYHNRQVACRCIVITSAKDVVDFFYYCRENSGSEPMDQFLRRIQSRVQVIRSNHDGVEGHEYRIQDCVESTEPLAVRVADSYQRVQTRYYFSDTEFWGDIGSAVSVLTDRVIINNPDVWGKQSRELKQEREQVDAVMNAYIADHAERQEQPEQKQVQMQQPEQTQPGIPYNRN